MWEKTTLILVFSSLLLIGACHTKKDDVLDAFCSDLEANLEKCQIDRFKAMEVPSILNTNIFYDEISELYREELYFDDFNILFDSLQIGKSMRRKVNFIRSIFYYKLTNREVDFERIFADFIDLKKKGGSFLKLETMADHYLKTSLLNNLPCHVGDTLDFILPVNGDTLLDFSRRSNPFIETKVLVKDYYREKVEKCDIEKDVRETYWIQFLKLDEPFFVHNRICRTGDTVSINWGLDMRNRYPAVADHAE